MQHRSWWRRRAGPKVGTPDSEPRLCRHSLKRSTVRTARTLLPCSHTRTRFPLLHLCRRIAPPAVRRAARLSNLPRLGRDSRKTLACVKPQRSRAHAHRENLIVASRTIFQNVASEVWFKSDTAVESRGWLCIRNRCTGAAGTNRTRVALVVEPRTRGSVTAAVFLRHGVVVRAARPCARGRQTLVTLFPERHSCLAGCATSVESRVVLLSHSSREKKHLSAGAKTSPGHNAVGAEVLGAVLGEDVGENVGAEVGRAVGETLCARRAR